MGRHAEGSRAPTRRDVPRTLALLGATALALALWVLLVLVAVSRGRDARLGGGTSEWLLAALVSAVAVGVLYLVMSLSLRTWSAWRGRELADVSGGKHRM